MGKAQATKKEDRIDRFLKNLITGGLLMTASLSYWQVCMHSTPRAEVILPPILVFLAWWNHYRT